MDQEVTDLLAELVRTKSVNPVAGDASREGFNEAPMAARVEEYLRGLGLEPTIQEAAPNRPNVYAVTPGSTSAPPILFGAHMDTVPADTWQGNAWEPVIREGRLYGRGACDTKASLAAMLVALKRYLDLGRPRQRVMVLATCDEECGLTGAYAWADLGLKAAFGIVGEPTSLQVVRAHKGAARWDLHVHGRSIHSARRDQGISAIVRMARLVLCIERLYQDVLRHRVHELLGHATLSIGTIRGGQTVNTVPDRCEISLDRRLLPGETPAAARDEIDRALHADPAIDFDVKFVDKTMGIGGLDTPENAPVVQRAARACERALGHSAIVGAPYGTEAPVYARAGIPCVVLGPGDIAVAHSGRECIDLEELEKAVGVYLAIMRGA